MTTDQPANPRIKWQSDSAASRTPESAPTPLRPATLAPTPILDRLGRDLTALARAGALTPVIGRDREQLQVARALLRREKANPLLLGDPGVGKTAIVEGLAQRIAAGDVDARLAGVRIVELPVAALVAGTALRGDLEERLLALVAEAAARPDVVLFIDEFHLAVGAGETSAGGPDIGNLLKPALARGAIRVIGATTAAEADRILRRDPALRRRLAPIMVEEPSIEDAIILLRGLVPTFAEHHRVEIEPSAADAAVLLSARYLKDRFLPDKAIDLLDDACTAVLLPTLAGSTPGIRVTPHDVTAALSARTGIAIAHLAGATRTETLDRDALERLLKADIIGQDAAIAAVADAVAIAAAGLNHAERPRGAFLFNGPTGVGKTALARSLARAISGDERALLRVDCTEYREPHDIARLVGSPPGYVGHDDGGSIARHLSRHQSGILLFDEADKANGALHDLLLQILDAGRLTDGRGDTLSLTNYTVILTTNLPSDDASLRRRFRPELLGRIDRQIAFAPLEFDSLEQIARRAIADLNTRMRDRGVILAADPIAIAALCRPESDHPANARTILRRIDDEVTAPLIRLLGTGLNGTPAMPVLLRLVAPNGTPTWDLGLPS